MKRKILTVLMALACVCALTACQGKTEPAAEYEPEDVQAIVDAGAFSEELEGLDGDTAFALYKLADCGLNRQDLTDCAVVRSAGATCEEGAVLVFASEDQAAKAAEGLRSYVDGQIDANKGYRPAEIPKLEGAWVDQQGGTVLLVVANDLDAAKSAVD